MTDDIDFTVTFSNWDPAFQTALEQTFPAEEADITDGQGFVGERTLTLISEIGTKIVDKLAGFLVAQKSADAARQITLEGPNGKIDLKGFGGDDLNGMKDALLELNAALRKK